jgi:hypothetical protein
MGIHLFSLGDVDDKINLSASFVDSTKRELKCNDDILSPRNLFQRLMRTQQQN